MKKLELFIKYGCCDQVSECASVRVDIFTKYLVIICSV